MYGHPMVERTVVVVVVVVGGVVACREVERERRTTSHSSPCSRIRFIREKDSVK